MMISEQPTAMVLGVAKVIDHGDSQVEMTFTEGLFDNLAKKFNLENGSNLVFVMDETGRVFITQ